MQAGGLCSKSTISAEVRAPVLDGDSNLIDDSDDPLPTFHPEFGRFMLEATPGKPWGIGFKDLLDVEPNMRRRLVPDRPRKSTVLNSAQKKNSERTHGAQ